MMWLMPRHLRLLKIKKKIELKKKHCMTWLMPRHFRLVIYFLNSLFYVACAMLLQYFIFLK